jgi:hypothetical protein
VRPPQPLNLTLATRQWADARETAAVRHWDIEDCSEPGSAVWADATGVPERALTSVNGTLRALEHSLHGVQPDPDALPNPWHACDARDELNALFEAAEEEGKTSGLERLDPDLYRFHAGREIRGGFVPDLIGNADYLFPEAQGLHGAALKVRGVPPHCLAQIDPPTTGLLALPAASPPVYVRLTSNGWQPLTSVGGWPARDVDGRLRDDTILDCSPLRQFAYTPKPGAAEVISFDGQTFMRSEGALWKEVLSEDESGRRVRHDSGPPPRYEFDALLALAASRQVPLKIDHHPALIAIDDVKGRFWLPIRDAQASAVRVDDERAEQCWDGAAFTRAHAAPGETRWQQDRALPVAAACDEKIPGTARLIPRMGRNTWTAAGERVNGLAQIDIEIDGYLGNCIDEILLTFESAKSALEHPGAIGARIGILLENDVPERVAAIRAALVPKLEKAIGMIASLREEGLPTVSLVEALPGNRPYRQQPGELLMTRQVRAVPPEDFKRFVTQWLLARHEQILILSSDGDANANLDRAAKMLSAEPALLQQYLATPARAGIEEDLEWVGAPRDAFLNAQDDHGRTVLQEVLLRDMCTVTSIVEKLAQE